MTLLYIAAFIVGAVLYDTLVPARWRGWVLLIASLIAAYVLQPFVPIHNLGFIFTAITLTLTVVTWWLVRGDHPVQAADRVALGLIALTAVAISLTQFLVPALRPQNPPPSLTTVLTALLVLIAAGLILGRLTIVREQQHRLRWAVIGIILVVFVILKTDALALTLASWLRVQTGQQADLAAVTDLQWLGFSYVAFRLIHTIRDRQTNRLPSLSLPEYASYILFFPSLTAGPIDRAEHFSPQYRALPSLQRLEPSRYTVGLTRIAIGLFKKFIIADSLALISLNPTNAVQATSTGALWLLLYAYAFRLYFDFSGYSDIAIGLGILFGIQLPENFDRPYLRQNLASFWQSWHITLGNWARFYVFSPLSRSLLKRKPKPHALTVVLVAQVATMLTIGLWHGVAWTFVVWALWHGVGLFVHKVWSDRTRAWYLSLKDRPRIRRAWTVVGILLTFHFVVLSWVWFALPNLQLAAMTWARLFGQGR